jgi:hypothetical protein
MPCSYVIDKERRLVVTDGSGPLTAAEMRAHDDQLRSDPDFHPEFNQLVDGTKISRIEGASAELRRVAGRSPFSSGSRRAFVSHRGFIFGMQRMFTTHVELSKTPSNVCVFHDFPSALKWLGLETLPEAIQPEGVKTEKPADTAKNDQIA